VVEPTDVHVLDEIGMPVLTLVTCYPFRFVGNAPQRYIVRAVAVDALTQEEEPS
jgi:sortase A